MPTQYIKVDDEVHATLARVRERTGISAAMITNVLIRRALGLSDLANTRYVMKAAAATAKEQGRDIL